jgi:phosphatidate phosphatase APP1
MFPVLLVLAVTLSALSLGATRANAAENSGLQVIFFPSVASVSDNGQGSMTIQGRIFTPAHGRHAGLVWFASRKFKIKTADEPFRSRAQLFFSDGHRDTRVSIKLGNRIIDLPPSDHSGFFSDVVLLSAADVGTAKDGLISFESVASTTGGQTIRGAAFIVPRDAIVVVTDMDDTIKDTRVLDRVLKERNTMVNEFKPVIGMPQAYSGWKAAPGANVHFHVVSAGPWQLYEPLRQFTDVQKFPSFTWDMRSVDIGYDLKVAISELHLKPETIFEHKVQKIRALLKLLPNQVVLVGDSAERDPEVYAEILKSCPARVAAVFIREITGGMPRDYDRLFRSDSGVKPQRFQKTSDLPNTLTPLKEGSSSQCR